MKARCPSFWVLGRVAAILSLAGALTISSRAASVSFSWTQNAETNIAGYNLYYGPTSGNYTNHVALGKVGSYTMNNLVNGATYYFALAAFNSNSVEGALTAELRFPNAPSLAVLANQTTSEDTPINIPLYLSDIDTFSSNLTVTATSSNLTLVPLSNITFSGSGTNRTMRIVPAANRTGTSTIGVTVSDGALTATRSFQLTVAAVNDGPAISAIANVTTDEDVFPPAISITISDTETALTNLTLRATSSNPTLIPTNRIIFGGSAGARTLVLQPVTNQNGTATITVTVSDGTLTANSTFNFTVRSINDPPTISQITDRNLAEDTQTQAIPFYVDDADTPLSQLVVTATSANQSIVSDSNIVLGGSGTNRTVVITPATNAVGAVAITFTVSDGQATASKVTTFTYLARNDPPGVSTPPNLTVNKLSPVPPVPFTVWDVETAASALTVSLSSSNTALLPTNRMTLTGTSSNRVLTLSPVTNITGTTRIGINVSDGTTNTQVFFLFTCTASNNPPVLTVGGPFSGNAAAAISVGGIRVSDPDAGTNNLNLRITAANGTINVNTSVVTGVKASQVTGNNSSNLTIVASLAALNATLTNVSAVTYTSRSGFSGTETLVVTLNDNGFSGTGGALTDTKNMLVQVASGASSLDTWRTTYFSNSDLQNPNKEATVWGDLADPDNDGRNNLIEFALGLNPLGSEPQDSVYVSGTVNRGGNVYQNLTFNARINEPSLQYIVEVSADNATWSAAQRVANTPVNAQFERVTYEDNVPITEQAARFIRLRVVKNGP